MLWVIMCARGHWHSRCRVSRRIRKSMKYCFLLLMLSVTAVIADGPYFRAGLGAALTENADADDFPLVGQTRLDLDAGFHLSAAGGMMFGDYFGLELETGFIVNEIGDI